MSCVPQEVAASQGLASTSSSLTTVHDIEEAIIVLVISVNIRHQSRCTGMQTVLLEAITFSCFASRPRSASTLKQGQTTSLEDNESQHCHPAAPVLGQRCWPV